jgi:hypothetical protein
MRAERMIGPMTRQRRPRTTAPVTSPAGSIDLVEGDFRELAPNRLRVGDITYVELPAAVLLRRDRRLACLGDPQHRARLDTLDMALWARNDRPSERWCTTATAVLIRYGQRPLDADTFSRPER